MPAVRTGPAVGLFAQIALLASLTVIVGVGSVGWLVGIGYGLVLCATLSRAMTGAGTDTLGPADRVTLTRAVLVGAVTALSVAASPPVPALVALAIVALALDRVDGIVARRSGTVSDLGARFDMEVDAFLILVLSVDAARLLGPWVLAIGVMRYAYAGAGWVLPWMRGTLPPRYWGKVVAAAQGVVLVTVTADVLPRPWALAATLAALAMLVESFGHSVLWLYQARLPDRPGVRTMVRTRR